ncbi:MAG TPA: type II toxin-antitoxin system VapC family toxin [Polyangiaceae bacterium]|jgi:predicted nucleic acid-binding protein
MLVDTNVISELARPRPNARIVRWLGEQSRIHLSVVTLEELAFGVARASGGARTRLSAWFDGLLAARPALLDVTPAIARASGELRAAREGRGRRVAMADMLIAATALANGLTLVTRNVRDFEGCGVELLDPFGA